MQVDNEEFVLKSRYLFIDSSVYHANNFQFAISDLASISDILKAGQLTLLITTITISEVKRHIKSLVAEAAAATQSLRDKGKILRNLPDFSNTFVFEGIDRSSVEDDLVSAFDSFVLAENVEIVSLDLVSAEVVFEKYFSQSPPFSEKKKEEFRDAFVLEALQAYAIENGVRIHVLSTDKDMINYCEGNPFLHCTGKLGPFVNAIVHSEYVEPAAFADMAFLAAGDDILILVEEYLESQDFGIVLSNEYNYRFDPCEIMHIEATNRRILSAERAGAKFAIDYEFVVRSVYFRTEPAVRTSGGGQSVEIHRWDDLYKKTMEAIVVLEFFEDDVESVVVGDWSFNLPNGDVLWEDELVEQVTTKPINNN